MVAVDADGELQELSTAAKLTIPIDGVMVSAEEATSYVKTDDGITETVDRSVDDITAWQNATVVRSIVTEAKVTYEFTLIQTNVDVIEFVTGATVTQSAPMGTYTMDPAATGGRKSFVFQIIDGAQLKRIYVAEGEITERGEITYASGEPIGYAVTIQAYTNPVVFDTALKT